MITAVISDIHGNLPALEAVLADAAACGAEQYAFLGDYVFDFPFANEVVRRLRTIPNAVFIAGNKEDRLPGFEREDQSTWNCEQLATVHQTFRELEPDVLKWLKSLPKELDLPLGGGRTARLMHFPAAITPILRRTYSSTEYFIRAEREPVGHDLLQAQFAASLRTEEYAAYFRGVEADAILFGHNHLQCFGWCGKKLVVDAGSCGVPLDFDNRAAYTLLEDGSSGIHATERRVSYDVENLIRATRKTEVYARGSVWCELLFRSISTGRDNTGYFLRFANAYAEREGSAERPFRNDIWRRAYAEFCAQLDAGAFLPKL